MLKGLDLTLKKGTVTALVGHSGAGKSTVAALLSRFYEPQAGIVRLGGQPAAAFTRGEWARAVALVSQEPVLFAGAPRSPRYRVRVRVKVVGARGCSSPRSPCCLRARRAPARARACGCHCF